MFWWNKNKKRADALVEGLKYLFSSAALYGINPVETLNDDYLLGYLCSQVLVVTTIHANGVPKDTDAVKILLYLFENFMSPAEAQNVVTRYCLNNNTNVEIKKGGELGAKVAFVMSGNRTYDSDSDVIKARSQAAGRSELMVKLRQKAGTPDTNAGGCLQDFYYHNYLKEKFGQKT